MEEIRNAHGVIIAADPIRVIPSLMVGGLKTSSTRPDPSR